MGLLGLPFAEADGGLGGGPVDMLIVMQALGRALALEPYLATVVLAGGLLRDAGSAAQRQALVPAIAAGEMTLAFAHAEAQSRYGLADVTTRARAEGDGWVLDGEKRFVLAGDSADRLIVSARGVRWLARSRRRLAVRRRCERRRRHAPRLPHAGPHARGRHPIRAGAGRSRCLARHPGAALPCIERAVDVAIAALCAEAVGVMERAARADRRVPQGPQAVRRRRSAASRRCSTAPWTCSSRSSRPAAWRCTRR